MPIIPIVHPLVRIAVPVRGPGVEPQYTFDDTDAVLPGTLVNVFGQLFTGITAGTRKVILSIADKNGLTIMRSPAFNVIGSGNLQTNNQDVSYTFNTSTGGPAGDADDGVLTGSMPDVLLFGGEILTLETINLEPVDLWGQVLLTVI